MYVMISSCTVYEVFGEGGPAREYYERGLGRYGLTDFVCPGLFSLQS